MWLYFRFHYVLIHDYYFIYFINFCILIFTEMKGLREEIKNKN